jgi:predicted RND superfamily exporter protein
MSLETIGRRIGQACVDHPKRTIAMFLVITAFFALGATRAAFSTDYRIFFSPTDPKLMALESMEKVFTKTDNIAFVVKPKSGDVFSPEAISAITALTEAGWKLPHAVRVDSLTNFQHSRADGDELIVEDLIPRGATDLARRKQLALAEPMLVGGLLAKDAGAAGINVTLRLPTATTEDVARAAEAARALLAEVSAAHPNLEIRVSGMALMNDAFMHASLRDMVVVFPLMAIVMLLVMVLSLGSRYATFSVVVIVAVSAIATLGTGGWLGYPLTPPSAAAPTIVLPLAVADAIHIIVSMTDAMRTGRTQKDAIVSSLGLNLKACILTNVTTSIGFLCLNFAEAPPFWHLANMTAAGVTMALIASMTLLPAMLALVRIEPKKSTSAGQAFSHRMAKLVVAARAPLLVGGVAVTIVLAVAASKLETNDQFLDYFDDAIPFRPDTEFFMKNLTGIYTLDYQLESGRDGGVSDPDYLAHAERFTAWLRQQPEVEHVFSVTDVVKRLNQNLNRDDPAFYCIPDTQELAGQYLLLYELSLPYGLDLNDRINIQKSSTRITVTVADMSSRELKAFAERTESWLRAHAPSPLWATGISPAIIFSHLGERNTTAMLWGNAVDLLLIALCLIFALRSVRLGIISLIPNLMPIIAAYGVWWLFVGEINIVASVAGAVALGLIVDDTIHFLTKYQVAIERGLEKEAAVEHVLGDLGPALVSTTAVLVGGFGVLGFSSFQMTSYLGIFTALTCTLGLIAEMTFLPALLLVTTRKAEHEQLSLVDAPTLH